MGAQRAAWMVSYRAESAARNGLHFGHSMLDLVKAYEKLPHHYIVQAARRLGYCLCTLRLSLASYRLPRALGADGAYSRLVIANLGITAGAGFATAELRILLYEVVTGTLRAWPLVAITLYVDDATIEAMHASLRTAQAVLAAATDQMVRHLLEALELEVSVKKSVVLGSTPSLGRAVALASRTQVLTSARCAKLLGVGACGGRRRTTKHLRVRISAFKKRVPRIQQLRRARVNAIRLARAAGTPMVTYGVDTHGFANAHLLDARRVIAKAVAPDAGGKSAELVLYAADGASGSLDPAFDAHCLPLRTWALAHWQRWVPPQHLNEALLVAKAKVNTANGPCWSRVCGPAAALVASACRIGWELISGRNAVTDVGESIDFLLDPPCVVLQAARRSVRRWRLTNITQMFLALIPSEPDVIVPHDRSGSDGTRAENI